MSLSPLSKYSNANLLVYSSSDYAIYVEGRVVPTPRKGYLIQLFLKRDNNSRRRVPNDLGANEGKILPGANGEINKYEGYALGFTEVPDLYNIEVDTPRRLGLKFYDIGYGLEFIRVGTKGKLDFGNDPIMDVTIDRMSGDYGGLGIDGIIYHEIRGFPITLTGAMITD